MSCAGRLLLLAVVVVAVSATPVPAAHSGGPGYTLASPAPAPLSQADFEADALRLEVTLDGDRPARLYVEYQFQLDGEDGNRTAAFESLQTDIKSNPDPYVDRFRSLLEPTVRRAENTTGRDMSLRNVTVTTGRRLTGDVGYVAYSVEWTNFAIERDGRLAAGAALSGLYLDERTKLLIAWSSSYRLAEVSPEPAETREQAVVWSGPMEFASTEPRVTLVPRRATGGLLGRLPIAPVAAAGLGALVALGGLALVLRRRRGGPEAPVPTDPELMSNEERVLHALEEHGGRLRQQELAAALEWTDPKTSRVVNRLRQDEAVDVFRLGRENVVSLPEYEDEP